MPFSVNSSNPSRSSTFSSSNNFTHLEVPITDAGSTFPQVVMQQLKGSQKWDEKFECWLASLFAKIAHSADNQDSKGAELRMLKVLHLLEFSDNEALTRSSQSLSYERLQETLRKLVKNLGQVNSAIVLARCYQLAHASHQFAQAQAKSMKGLFNSLLSAFEQKYQHYVKKEDVQKELDVTTLSSALSEDLKTKATQREKIKKTALVLLGLVATSGLLALQQSYGVKAPAEKNQKDSLTSKQPSQENFSSNAVNSSTLENHDITHYSKESSSSLSSAGLASNEPKNAEEVPRILIDGIVPPISVVNPLVAEILLTHKDIPINDIQVDKIVPPVDDVRSLIEDTPIDAGMPSEITGTVDKILNTFNTFFHSEPPIETVVKGSEEVKDESASKQLSEDESSPSTHSTSSIDQPAAKLDEEIDVPTIDTSIADDIKKPAVPAPASAVEDAELSTESPTLPAAPTPQPQPTKDTQDSVVSPIAAKALPVVSEPKKVISPEDQAEILELKAYKLREIYTVARCKELLRKHIGSIIPENSVEQSSLLDAPSLFYKVFYAQDVTIQTFFNWSLKDIGSHIGSDILNMLPNNFLGKLWPYVNSAALGGLTPKTIESISPEKIVLNDSLFNNPQLVKALTNEQLKAFFERKTYFPRTHLTDKQKDYWKQL